MKTVRILLICLIVGMALAVSGQVAGTTPSNIPAANPVAANLRILTPLNGQRLGVDFVNVQYEITNPAAGVNDLTTFQVQLDSTDPVITSSTEHTFTGLKPGRHTIFVQVVDANGTPVAGTRAEVHFLVLQPSPGPARGSGNSTQTHSTAYSVNGHVQAAGKQRHVENRPQSDNNATTAPGSAPGNSLPGGGNSLPILSVIGFGVLVGGIASALRTR